MPAYAAPAYARALDPHLGSAVALPQSQVHLFARAIGSSGHRDLCGAYPFLVTSTPQRLVSDLRSLGTDFVSLTFVTDPLHESHVPLLRPALMFARPYKTHYIRDLSKSLTDAAAHHRRNARKALQALEVSEVSPSDPKWRLSWTDLYTSFAQRRGFHGASAFPPESLALQLDVPGSMLFVATRNGRPVGMTHWYATGNAAYYHLGASTDEGRALRSSFALFWHVFQHLSERGVEQAVLGSGAGVEPDPASGLERFKRGWATRTCSTFLCGKVLNPAAYAELTRHLPHHDFFPLYRRFSLPPV